jgi:predicted amidophosphoribosyltransferase
VLLVDDVYTTGATARGCAAALASAGAAVVDVWTLAHTAPPDSGAPSRSAGRSG